MAGAIPRALERVPVDDAAEVRADGRGPMQGTGLVSVNGELLQTLAHDSALAGPDLSFGADFPQG
jgi:hypothetical protein